MKNVRHATFLLLFLTTAAYAAPERDPKPYLSAQRMLAVNRSLLARAEADYQDLQSQTPPEESPSEETARQLADLRYKIKALQDDAARLQSELPKSLRADEFMKDLEERRTGTGETRPAMDVEREKRMSEGLSEVFDKHEKALALVAEKKYGAAARLYEAIVLLSPDDDEAYLLLGHCRLLNMEYDKARDAFLNAVHINPANAREVTRLYENILVENPQDDEAYTHLGFAHLMLEQRAEALQDFQSALDINPYNLEARTAMAGLASQIQ